MKSSGSSRLPYVYVITKTAKKDLEALPAPVKKAIGQKLREYLDSGDPLHYAKRLIDAKIGTYRFRVGDYRISFDADGAEIIILRVRNRRDIYK